jgi:hypothetical protein
MKKLWILALLFSFALPFTSSAQQADDMYFWKILSKVKYKSKLDIESGEVIYTPIFNKNIEKLEGETIILKGYVIPADLTGGKMTLSAFPYSSCFFCGGAGPESVIEVEAASPIIYRMDKAVILEGKLKLNRDDPLRLMYILEDASYAKDR